METSKKRRRDDEQHVASRSSTLFGSSLTASIFGERQQQTSSTNTDLFASATQFDDAVKERFDRNAQKSGRRDEPDTAAREAKQPSLDMILEQRQVQSLSAFLDTVSSVAPYPVDDRVVHDEEIPVPPDVKVQEIADIVRQYGFAVVRNVISRSLMKELCSRADEIETQLCASLDQRQIEWRCNDERDAQMFRFQEVASRCKGRMDVRYGTNELPFSSPDIVENKSLLPIVQSLLGGSASMDPSHEPILLYAGLILSQPGSDDQPWHQDGMPLFPELNPSKAMLPPYAMNVFLPLSDRDGCLEAGPTEFVPKSHAMEEEVAVQKVEQAKASDSRKVSFQEQQVLPGIVSPLLNQGDALLYDYRVCHRGTSNLTTSSGKAFTRRILYLMYARPWFKEHLNFGSERLFSASRRS